MTWWNPMEDKLPGDTEKNRRNVSYEKLEMSKLKKFQKYLLIITLELNTL